MLDRLVALIVDEGKWLSASMVLAGATALVTWRRTREAEEKLRRLGVMTVFFATTIAVMAFGHLLAVSTKLALGTLEGSRPAFFAIGIALALPSWWLLGRTLAGRGRDPGRAGLVLHGWTVATLLALGLHNLPLALPGLLDCAYQVHTRRRVGQALLVAAALVNGALFVGSLVFLASGQSFEQFSTSG